MGGHGRTILEHAELNSRSYQQIRALFHLDPVNRGHAAARADVRSWTGTMPVKAYAVMCVASRHLGLRAWGVWGMAMGATPDVRARGHPQRPLDASVPTAMNGSDDNPRRGMRVNDSALCGHAAWLSQTHTLWYKA